MSWLDGMIHRLRVAVRGDRYAKEQRDELRFHLDLEAQQHTVNGNAEARRRMGNLTGVEERLRDAAGMAWIDRVRQDVHYAFRGLRRSPAFTITVVLTIALGVGANAAMFSFLDRVFFRDPPGVARASEVRRIYFHERDPFGAQGATRAMQRFGYPEFDAIQRAVPVDVAADIPPAALASGPRGDSLPQTSYVSEHYFKVLGLTPAIGRFFTHEEADVATDSRVAVITHAYWKRAFALDPAILGKRVTAYGKDYTIIGVTAAGFAGIDVRALEMMLPLHAYPAVRNGKAWYEDNDTWSPLRPIVRADPSMNDDALLGNAGRAYREAMREHRRADSTIRLVSGPIIAANGPAENAKELTLSGRLAGVTLAVMLIACANVASLLLVRAARRRREIAVRLALGVSRRRLWGQVFTESLLLAAIASAFALLVAHWAGTALRKLLLPTNVWAGAALDARVIVFTIGTAFAVGIVAGLVPAFASMSTGVTEALKSGARTAGGGRSYGRSMLLAAQGALSLVLLVAAGLFIRTRDNIRSMPLGFDHQRMIYVTATAPDSVGPRVSLALAQVADAMSKVPGVRATAISSDVPMSSNRSGFASLPDNPKRLTSYGSGVSADFFAATGMTFVAGRAFTRTEAETKAPVVVVNEAFARQAWPEEDAIGQCLMLGLAAKTCTYVVGVTATARNFEILEGRVYASYYAPLSATLGSFYRPNAVIINADPSVAAQVVKRATDELKALLPGIGTVRGVRTSERLVDQYRPWELGAKLFTTFGILALIVAAIGVYSVVAYTISLRTREMGVRVALGAQVRDLLDLVVGGGMRVVGIGIAAGIVIALGVGKFIESQLFGVSVRDPYVIIGAGSVLTGVALFASLIPAWRAARVSPVEALRSE